MNKLYDIWAKKNPRFEKEFDKSIVQMYCQYGGGSAEGQVGKGKTFNAGYEIFIYAFFLGLYANNRRALINRDGFFGQPIQFWGNVTQKGRHQYSQIRNYIFAAVVAKTEIDLIAIEKGEIPVEEGVSQLIKTMEEYANGGFYMIQAKMETNPGFFFENTGFLNMLISQCQESDEDDDD